jgi:hypothetical protein
VHVHGRLRVDVADGGPLRGKNRSSRCADIGG